jgi:hypothetical protein
VVRASVFNRHVTQKLCWIDGSPTHASSARQRQCPLCRRKWSYDGLSKRWLLAQEYCAGRNRRAAAQAVGVDVHTAGRHYAAFERALADHLRRNLELGRAWKFAAIRSPRRIGAEKPPSPRQVRRLAAQLCLEGLSVYRRMQLIYDVVFSARVERLLRQKPIRCQ